MAISSYSDCILKIIRSQFKMTAFRHKIRCLGRVTPSISPTSFSMAPTTWQEHFKYLFRSYNRQYRKAYPSSCPLNLLSPAFFNSWETRKKKSNCCFQADVPVNIRLQSFWPPEAHKAPYSAVQTTHSNSRPKPQAHRCGHFTSL